jgi:hypothetical protein
MNTPEFEHAVPDPIDRWEIEELRKATNAHLAQLTDGERAIINDACIRCGARSKKLNKWLANPCLAGGEDFFIIGSPLGDAYPLSVAFIDRILDISNADR